MESQEKQYKYYAFISYSRKNSKAAKYLHKQLEHFRVPVKYVAKENLPPHPKFLRPVFRDRRDLEAGEGSFTNDIKVAIEQSRYLLVLCSPESAASIWVNEEIKHFLATHDNDFSAIVPVVLNGEPGSGGAAECLPEALRQDEITMRNLPSMIPDDGDDEKTGWENGVVQAMSYMLKVQREKVKATVDAGKVRQAKIYAAIGIAATIIFALLTTWALHAERQAAANEKRAIAGEKLAQDNEAKAKANEKLAKENEAQAKTNEKLAKDNEAKAKANEKRAIAGEKEAKKQAELAQKTLSFIKQMLEDDPEGKGAARNIRDILMAQNLKINSLEPVELKVSVCEVVGGLFVMNSIFKPALPMLEFAYDYYVKHSDTNGAVRLANSLGVYFVMTDQPQKAEKYYKLVKKNKNMPVDSRLIININLSDNYLRLNDRKKAEKYALQALEEVKNSTDYHKIMARLQLAKVYLGQENLKDMHRQLSCVDEKFLLSNSAYKKYLMYFYNAWGGYYKAKGEFTSALKFFEKELRVATEVFGEKNIHTVTANNNVGFLCQMLNKYKEAWEHLQKALNNVRQIYPDGSALEGQLCNNIGTLLFSLNSRIEAEKMIRRSLELRIRFNGEKSAETVESLINLAFLLCAEKKYDEALKLYERALRNVNAFSGGNTRSAATIYNNIGEIYRTKKDYIIAVEQFRKALNIMTAVLGENNQDLFVAKINNNLALTYFAMNDRDNARKHITSAVQFAMKNLPPHNASRRMFLINKEVIDNPRTAAGRISANPDEETENSRKIDDAKRYIRKAEKNPDEAADSYREAEKLLREVLTYQLKTDQKLSNRTALVYNDLGHIMTNTRRPREGVALLHNALEINTQIHGVNYRESVANLSNIFGAYKMLNDWHQAIKYGLMYADAFRNVNGENMRFAIICNDLALCYSKIGNSDKALNHYRQAIEVYLATGEKDYVNAANFYANIANHYGMMKNYKKAVESYLKTLELLNRIPQNRTKEIALYSNQIAIVFFRLGDLEAAYKYYQKALNLNIKVYGKKNREVATNCMNIADVLNKQKKYDEAIKYAERALKIRLELLGERHKDVFLCYNALGLLYDSVEKYDKALEYHKKSYDIALILFGSEDRELKTAAWNVAVLYCNQKKYSSAEPFAEKCLNLSILLYGEDSPETLEVYEKAAEIYFNLKKYSNAAAFYRKSVEIACRLQHFDLTEKFWTNLRLSFIKLEKYDALENLLDQYMAMIRKGNDSEMVSILLRQKMRLYGTINDLEKCRQAFEEDLELRLQKNGKKSAHVSMTYWIWAEMLSNNKHYAEAQKYYEYSLNVDMALDKKPWADIILNNGNIACCLFYQGKYQETVKQCEVTLDLINKHQPDNSSRNSYLEILQKSQHILKNNALICLVKKINPNTVADKSGVKAGDFILDYAGSDWTTGNVKMASDIQRVRNVEKQLIFARKNPDGSFQIFSKTFPAGMMGMELREDWINIKDYNKIMEVYKEFSKQEKK